MHHTSLFLPYGSKNTKTNESIADRLLKKLYMNMTIDLTSSQKSSSLVIRLFCATNPPPLLHPSSTSISLSFHHAATALGLVCSFLTRRVALPNDRAEQDLRCGHPTF